MQLERELNEMTARAVSLAHGLPPETLCGDIQKLRDAYLSMQRELAAAKDLAESTGRRQIHVCMFCGMESAAGDTQTERKKP
jgi:hypothetical protein